MLFSSPVFLFGFLPVTLFIYYFSPKSVKNLILLLCSLFFYAWGEVFYLAVMLISISANYIFGLLIYKYQELSNKKLASLYVTMGVGVNMILLISFKYANFVVDNINIVLTLFDIKILGLAPVHLPLGISFFTFQAISYIVDVYRKEVPAQRNIFNLALYISLFPQLIAGPIVRYHDVALQITNRTSD